MTPACREALRSFLLEHAAAESEQTVRIILLMLLGAAGTLARYGLDGWIQNRLGAAFPAGTLTINVLGCFLLGVIGQYSLTHLSVPPEWRIGMTTGMMGAFTTFSTFGWESVRMVQTGEWAKAALYIGASLLVGLVAMILGMRLGNA